MASNHHFLCKRELGWPAASYREACTKPSGVVSLFLTLRPQCAGCSCSSLLPLPFRGLMLGMHLLLWAGLCINKGEVGDIVHGIAGVVGE